MPKYVLHVDGTDRTIDTDKFDAHYDALRQDNPDVRIKVRDGSGGIGTVPLAFWKEAVESGRFAPYTQDEAIRLSDRTQNAPAGFPLPPDTGNYVERPAEKDRKAAGYAPGVPYDWERYGVRLPEYEPVPELSAEEVEAYKGNIKSSLEALHGELEPEINRRFYTWKNAQDRFREKHRALAALSNLGRGGNRVDTDATPEYTDPAYANLVAAQRMLDDSQKLIRQAEINKNEGGTFAGNVGRGLRDGLFDPRTWDAGLGELAQNTALLGAIDKFEKGKTLSSDEQALLDASAIRMAAQMYYGEDVGRGYTAGKSTAQSVPFMMEMLINPASGAGKGIASGLTKYLMKRFGKKFVKSLPGKMLRGGARAGADALGAAAMSASTGSVGVLADAAGRRIGQPKAAPDETGRMEYAGREGGEDWGTALGKSFGARTIENFSEMAGNYFGPIGKAVGKSRPVRALKASKVGKMLDRVSTSDWAKAVGDFEQKAQWHGVLGEYGEEAVGTALNALLVEDNQLSDLTDADQQIETFLSVALMGGFFSAVQTAGYRTPAYSARRRTERAASEAAGTMGSGWELWRKGFETADMGERNGMIGALLQDEQMTEEQKRAVLEYVSARTAYEGIRKAEDKREAEGAISPLEAELRETYGVGQQMQEADPQTKGELWQAYEQAKAPFTDEELTRMENILPEVYLAEHPDRAEAIGTYYRAKAAYEGLVDATREEIDRRAKEAATAVDQTAHPDGQVYTAALKDNPTAPVHIIGGELVLKPDGTVDVEKSGNYLTIRKGDGQTAMVSPKRIAAVEAQEAAELREATVQTVRQEAARQEAEQIEQAAAQKGERQGETAPAYQTGDELSLHIGNNLVTGTVQQPTPEGNFVVRFDGWTEIPGIGAGQAIVFTPEQLNALTQAPQTASEPNSAADVPPPVGETDASIRTAPAAETAEPAPGQTQTNGSRMEAELPSTQQPEMETAPQDESAAVAEPLSFPRDRAGEIDYDRISDPALYAAALIEEFEEEAPQVLAGVIGEQEKEMEKARKKVKEIDRRRAIKRVQAQLDKLAAVQKLLTPAENPAETASVSEPAPAPEIQEATLQEAQETTPAPASENATAQEVLGENGETQAWEEKTVDRPAVDEASQPAEAVDPVRDAAAPVEKYRAVGELVNEMNRLSGAKAYVFNDVSELPADLQTMLGPGFEHDGITWLRESYICVPQMTDAEGVRRTYIHEVAGHLNIEYAIRKTADRTALWEAVVDDIGIETLRSWDIPELNEAIEEYETGERPKRELGREAMAYATELNADLPYFTPKEKPLSLTIDLNQRIYPKTIREILNAANRYDNERQPEIIIANPGREGLSRNVHGAVRPAGGGIRTGDDTFPEDTRSDLSRDATTDPSGRDAAGSGVETGNENDSGTISGQVRTGADRNQQKAVPARETVSESRFRKASDGSTAKPIPFQRELLETGEPQSAREVIAYLIASGMKIKFNDAKGSRGFAAHLGLKPNSSEVREYFNIRSEKTGYTPEVMAERILADDRSGFFAGMDSMEAVDLILDLIPRINTRRKALRYLQENRERAEDDAEAYVGQLRYRQDLEDFGIRYEDYLEENFNFTNTDYTDINNLFADHDGSENRRSPENNRPFPQGKESDPTGLGRDVEKGDSADEGSRKVVAGRTGRGPQVGEYVEKNEYGREPERGRTGNIPEGEVQTEHVAGPDNVLVRGGRLVAEPERGGTGGISERAGRGIEAEPSVAANETEPRTAQDDSTETEPRYREDDDADAEHRRNFEALAAGYDELLENRENNPNFEEDLNDWRDRKAEVVRSYYEDLAARYGLSQRVEVFNGMRDTLTLEKIYKAENPDAQKEDLQDFVGWWQEWSEGPVGCRLPGHNEIWIEIARSDGQVTPEAYRQILVHEATHALNERLLSPEELIRAAESAKDVPLLENVLSKYYQNKTDVQKGDEVIAYTIGLLTMPSNSETFDRFMGGEIMAEEAANYIRAEMPGAKEAIVKILNGFKDEQRRRNARQAGRTNSGNEGRANEIRTVPGAETTDRQVSWHHPGRIGYDQRDRGRPLTDDEQRRRNARQTDGTTAGRSTEGSPTTNSGRAETAIPGIYAKVQRWGAGFADHSGRRPLTDLQWEAHSREAARELAGRLGVQVEFISPLQLSPEHRRAKGAFDPKSGSIRICLRNHSDEADVCRTLFHEAVAHKGLRELFGKDFDAFLDRVYADAAPEIRARIVESARRRDWNTRLATEEYLAGLAERGFEDPAQQTLWGKVKAAFREMLVRLRLSLGSVLTDNDLRYVLWRSYRNLQGGKGTILNAAEDARMRYRLGVGMTEEERIVARAKADGTYLKAPNGRPTNLTPEQWTAVRTRAFKDRFGDWEKNARIEKLRRSRPVEITGEEYKGRYELNRDSAQAYILNHLRGEYRVNDTGETVKIGRKGAMKVTSHSTGSEAHLKSVAVIPQLIENAIFIEERPAEKSNAQYDSYRYYVTGLKIGGTDYTVRLTIGVKNGEYYYDHYLTQIEKGNLLEIAQGFTPTEDAPNPSYAEIKDTRIIPLLQPFRQKNLDENGEPGADEAAAFLPASEIRYREEAEETARSAQEYYDRGVTGILFKAKEGYQDAMASLKVFQEAIGRESGKEIGDHENAYLFENHLSSINKPEWENTYRDCFDPVVQNFTDLIRKGKSREDVNAYLIAKHGLERNEVLARRDADRMLAEGMEKLDKQRKAETLSDAEYEKRRERLEKKRQADYEKFRKRDYSGLTALTGEEREFETVARGMVETFEEGVEAEVKKLWEAIGKANARTLKKAFDTGLIDRKTYEHTRGMFSHYVPLRGWKEETASDVYEYLLSHQSKLGAPVKKAKGRTSLADDPIATMMNMAHGTILQGNRNRMKQRFLNAVINHPTSLATVRDMWYVNRGTEENPLWEQSVAEIPEGATPEQTAQAIEEHEALMRELEAAGRARRSKEGLKLSYRALPQQVKEHTVTVREAGRERVVYINGNPRVAQAVNGLLSGEAVGRGHQVFREAQRWLAMMYTGRNPEFVVSNMQRDFVAANATLAIKENGAYVARFNRNYANNLFPVKVRGDRAGEKGGIYRLFRLYEQGKLDMSRAEERYFKEFMDNGGETGYTRLFSVDEFKKSLREATGEKSQAAKVMHSIGIGVEYLNRAAESTTRFAAYMTSRQMGRSVLRSVADAKDVTVNFNRRGSGRGVAKWFHTFCIFFNPAIQSLELYSRLARTRPKKFIATCSVFAAVGFMVASLNRVLASLFGGDDEDEYYGLTPWKRRNSLCIWAGDGYITYNLPIELRAFYGMGEILRSWYDGKMRYESVPLALTAQLADLLPVNPMGDVENLSWKSVVNSLMPAVVKPLTEAILFNEDFTGQAIWKETPFNERDPEWKRVYRGTSSWLVAASKWCNEATGGDDYKRGFINWNPAKVEHVITGYLGGLGTFSTKLVKSFQALLGNEEYRDVRNYPFISRMFAHVDKERGADYYIRQAYDFYRDEAEETAHLLKGYEAAAGTGVLDYAEKYRLVHLSPEYKRHTVFREYEKIIDQLYDLSKQVEGERQQWLQTQINLYKADLVERLEAIR